MPAWLRKDSCLKPALSGNLAAGGPQGSTLGQPGPLSGAAAAGAAAHVTCRQLGGQPAGCGRGALVGVLCFRGTSPHPKEWRSLEIAPASMLSFMHQRALPPPPPCTPPVPPGFCSCFSRRLTAWLCGAGGFSCLVLGAADGGAWGPAPLGSPVLTRPRGDGCGRRFRSD